MSSEEQQRTKLQCAEKKTHRKLSGTEVHLGVKYLKRLVKDCKVEGFYYHLSKNLKVCEPCISGK